MEHFTVPYSRAKKESVMNIYVGEPSPIDKNPIYYQQLWARLYLGGEISKAVINSFKELKSIADKNDVSFQDLCVYSITPENYDTPKKKKSPDERNYYWCDQPCESLEELSAIADAVTWYLFGVHRKSRPIWGNVVDAFYDTAEAYFHAIMICAGIREAAGPCKPENFDFFKHMQPQVSAKNRPTGKYLDNYEHESFQVCVILDVQGRFIPARIRGFLGDYVTHGSSTTSSINKIIRDALIETSKLKGLIIPAVPTAHSKAFLKFCKNFAKIYKERSENLVKPATKKKKK